MVHLEQYMFPRVALGSCTLQVDVQLSHAHNTLLRDSARGVSSTRKEKNGSNLTSVFDSLNRHFHPKEIQHTHVGFLLTT